MSKVGAILLTAGEKTKGLASLCVVEGKTVIECIIDTLKKYDVAPVTLVLGDQKAIIEKCIQNKDVRIVYSRQSEKKHMLDSIKLGIRDLRDLCGRILIIRSDIPAFSEETLKKLLRTDMPLVRPVYKGRTGNPVIIRSEYFDTVLDYEGEGGMKEAFDRAGVDFTDVPVDDIGILLKSDDQDDFVLIKEIKAIENNRGLPFNCVIDLKIRSISPFFNNESALLLEMIDNTHCIKTACDCIHMSYSKAWTMIRMIEQETGIRFVIKKIGGFKGGNTVLTDEGREFVKDYRNMIRKMQNNTEDMFQEVFSKYMK